VKSAWDETSFAAIAQYLSIGGLVKEPMEITSVELSIVLRVPYNTEATEFIMSGPEGTTLKKVGKGFLLVEGEAYFVQRASP